MSFVSFVVQFFFSCDPNVRAPPQPGLRPDSSPVETGEQGRPLPERDGFGPGLAYSRIARARVHGERRAAQRAERRARRRRDVVKGVERLADQEVLEDEDDSEAFYENLYERLDVEQELTGFDTRPVAEIVARICKDLGVAVETVVGVGDEFEGARPGEQRLRRGSG
ncbi:MAG: hypothetical protein P4L64_11205 [Caulobacteraceae bacterium]|nr:hypothetical protein [Caulobacteraceae bacterium]